MGMAGVAMSPALLYRPPVPTDDEADITNYMYELLHPTERYGRSWDWSMEQVGFVFEVVLPDRWSR